jgi:hypothetical protein
MCKYWILVLLAVTAYLGKGTILGEQFLAMRIRGQGQCSPAIVTKKLRLSLKHSK